VIGGNSDRALAIMQKVYEPFMPPVLVTDINTQNSLMLVKADPELIRRISYPHIEQDEIFDLRGVVSRKKQLIPYLTSLLKEMQADGVSPATKGRTNPPHGKGN